MAHLIMYRAGSSGVVLELRLPKQEADWVAMRPWSQKAATGHSPAAMLQELDTQFWLRWESGRCPWVASIYCAAKRARMRALLATLIHRRRAGRGRGEASLPLSPAANVLGLQRVSGPGSPGSPALP